MVKKVIASALLALGLIWSIPNISFAEYITASETMKYEKYVVDTTSIFYPNKDDHRSMFNVIVWFYNDYNDQSKGSAFCFKYKFEDNQWKIHASDDKWNVVENNSIASDVLRVTLPYLK